MNTNLNKKDENSKFGGHEALKKAKEYASLFEDNYIQKKQIEIHYLAGYKNAIEDSKAPEMLEMLKRVYNETNHNTPLYPEILQLIKQATEL